MKAKPKQAKALKIQDPSRLAQRFWRHTRASNGNGKGNGCVLWCGRVNTWGTGEVKGPAYNKQLAHRIAYCLEHGPLPAGMAVYRTCGNMRCVAPEHLVALPQYGEEMRQFRGRRAARKLGGVKH